MDNKTGVHTDGLQMFKGVKSTVQQAPYYFSLNV